MPHKSIRTKDETYNKVLRAHGALEYFFGEKMTLDSTIYWACLGLDILFQAYLKMRAMDMVTKEENGTIKRNVDAEAILRELVLAYEEFLNEVNKGKKE